MGAHGGAHGGARGEIMGRSWARARGAPARPPRGTRGSQRQSEATEAIRSNQKQSDLHEGLEVYLSEAARDDGVEEDVAARGAAAFGLTLQPAQRGGQAAPVPRRQLLQHERRVARGRGEPRLRRHVEDSGGHEQLQPEVTHVRVDEGAARALRREHLRKRQARARSSGAGQSEAVRSHQTQSDAIRRQQPATGCKACQRLGARAGAGLGRGEGCGRGVRVRPRGDGCRCGWAGAGGPVRLSRAGPTAGGGPHLRMIQADLREVGAKDEEGPEPRAGELPGERAEVPRRVVSSGGVERERDCKGQDVQGGDEGQQDGDDGGVDALGRVDLKQPDAIRRNQTQPDATRRSQTQPDAARRNQTQPDAIRRNQTRRQETRRPSSQATRSPSRAVRSNQKQSQSTSPAIEPSDEKPE